MGCIVCGTYIPLQLFGIPFWVVCICTQKIVLSTGFCLLEGVGDQARTTVLNGFPLRNNATNLIRSAFPSNNDWHIAFVCFYTCNTSLFHVGL